MEGLHPTSGGPAKGELIPPVSYLKWYIPRLKEMRPHNLSFSGLQFPWELDSINEIWKDHRGPGVDDRKLVGVGHIRNGGAPAGVRLENTDI